MKRLLLFFTICISSFSFGQIYQNDTTICVGDSILISILSINDCGSHDNSLNIGLSGWYPLCSNADDLSSNSNNGVLNGVLPALDFFNNQNSAYSFNGVNNTIDLPNHFLGGAQVNAFTVNARVKFNDLSNSPNIWGKTKFWGEVNFAVLNTGEVRFWWANSITGNKYSTIRTVNSVILPGQWYDITVVFQNGAGQIYVDAQPVNTSLLWSAQGGATLSTTSIENSCNFSQDANSSKLGVRKSGNSLVGYLNGTLDEFKIWNYALNQAAVTQNYNSGASATIVWSNGMNNEDSIFVQPIQTTTYTVNVNSSNSSYTDSLTIIVNYPQVDAGVDVDVCNGGIITLSGTGADTYVWSGSVIDGVAFGPTESEYYYVTGTDTLGCQAEDSVFVTILQPTTSSISESNCDTYNAPDGTTYTTTGIYTAVIPNTVGCDSTITIDLTITNSSSSSITETVTECNSFTWGANSQTYTSSGQYTAVLTNAVGCDSTVILDLIINSVDNGITQVDDFTLQANATGASYQWIDCADESAVVGATNQQFAPAENGDYAVIVTQNGCSDTTECLSVSRLSILEHEQTLLVVYPNPATSMITIENPQGIASNYVVLDAQGRQVHAGKLQGETTSIDVAHIANGMYTITFVESKLKEIKFIKE